VCLKLQARTNPGHTQPAVALPHQDGYSLVSPATRTEHLPSHVHLPYSFRSGQTCHYPPDLSDRLWLKVSRPRREGSVQAESLCIQLISWLTAFPSLLLSNSGTEFFGITQQACGGADHVIVSGSSLLSDASHDTSVAVPVDLTLSVCEGSQQNDCTHRQWSRSPTRVQYRSSYAQGWLGLWGSCNSTSEVSIV
jgi:hypothetical protein